MTRQSRKASTPEPQPLQQIPVWWSEPEEGDGPSETGDAPSGTQEGVSALLAGLNVEQRRAVCHGGGPLLVVAGGGAGENPGVKGRTSRLVVARPGRAAE